jgi:hypothetical protein
MFEKYHFVNGSITCLAGSNINIIYVIAKHASNTFLIKVVFTMSILKEVIIKRVKELGKKQNDLAAFLGITPTAYHLAFNTESWKLRQLVQIADFLEGDLTIIFGKNPGANFNYDLSTEKKISSDIAKEPYADYKREIDNENEFMKKEIELLRKQIEKQDENVEFLKGLIKK